MRNYCYLSFAAVFNLIALVPAANGTLIVIEEQPRVFSLLMTGGPITSDTFTSYVFGTYWSLSFDVTEQATGAGDILGVTFTIQHLLGDSPGQGGLPGPTFSRSLLLDATDPSTHGAGELTTYTQLLLAPHGPGRVDSGHYHLIGYTLSPDRYSTDIALWRFMIEVADVSEPATFGLAATGFACLFLIAHRRRRHRPGRTYTCSSSL